MLRHSLVRAEVGLSLHRLIKALLIFREALAAPCQPLLQLRAVVDRKVAMDEVLTLGSSLPLPNGLIWKACIPDLFKMPLQHLLRRITFVVSPSFVGFR